MIITSIRPRRDGQWLVGLHWTHGVSRRKVMTTEALRQLQARLWLAQQAQQAQQAAQPQPAL